MFNFKRIKNFAALTVVFSSLIACGGGGSAEDVDNIVLKNQKILMVGDSLTDDVYAGWSKQMQVKIDSENLNATIINQAHGGETSLDAVGRIDDYLKTDADIVFIYLGTNDILHLATPAQTEANIRLIMTKLNEQKPRKFILTNLVWLDGFVKYTEKSKFVNDLGDVIPRIANDFPNVTVVQNYYKDIELSDLSDVLHVLSKSQEKIMNNMYIVFKSVILK